MRIMEPCTAVKFQCPKSQNPCLEWEHSRFLVNYLYIDLKLDAYVTILLLPR
ncbi:hypothetical protein KsCSTR_06840 [Candidatus Kuenenia stuttgartiensis]|uniref:Uncharacterized protein n=1 Tax=Kuenenia stuttgartiensis TaxID=174633 RepID=Q1PZQ1_KUEST|nr:hypothetical protein KsCSTR_06840 [Candidatus Kuenenia stuttgartiensis]CAJ72558.1 unknown protein [Candidatus Kuenenia stuttgartiensis]